MSLVAEPLTSAPLLPHALAATAAPAGQPTSPPGSRCESFLPRFVVLEVVPSAAAGELAAPEAAADRALGPAVGAQVGPTAGGAQEDPLSGTLPKPPESPPPETMLLTRDVAARIPYVVSALSAEWRKKPSSVEVADQATGAAVPPVLDVECSEGACASTACAKPPVVQIFMPAGCPCSILRALLARLAAHADTAAQLGLAVHWTPGELSASLRLVQVASMLQMEELLPELIELVRETVLVTGDFAALDEACRRLELPAGLREAAAALRPRFEPLGLPTEAQVRGMIASALLTADGKVWRVVQKVIDRREVWPHLAKENAAVLLAFATGTHGSIRATPHTGFFWGSRDFLYLLCRHIRGRSEHFDVMVSAMFDSVYNMDPELPAEIIDAVFKELLVHEGLSLAQCEHVITKLMEQDNQLEYLFHEWSGIFPQLPPNARQALSKGLLPAIGRCPHAALDFVLGELDLVPMRVEAGLGRIYRLAQSCRSWHSRCRGHTNGTAWAHTALVLAYGGAMVSVLLAFFLHFSLQAEWG